MYGAVIVKDDLEPFIQELQKHPPDVMKRVTKRVEAQILGEYQSITRNWETPVDFSIRKTFGFQYGFEVVTKSQVFMWVDEGTKPHLISPNYGALKKVQIKPGQFRFQRISTFRKQKRGRFVKPEDLRLAFNPVYQPGTAPGRWGFAHGPVGDNLVTPKLVKHPGSVPRNFNSKIMQKVNKIVPDMLAEEMTRSVSGRR